ncbi:hypothetical protein ONZ45_g9326 [Pleurotus djamor]|nr:hypothetical protein ONZ45_g9326 [Pleurotus djamor]
MSESLNILAVGASKNIGYYATSKFLALGHTVTFLLRSVSVFDDNAAIQNYVKCGHAQLVKGDALVQADVQRAWDEAARKGAIDVVLFTVGGTPTFHILKGAIITPPNLVTQCFANVLCTIPKTSPLPKIVTISSLGLTKDGHNALPLALKPLYGYLLKLPHKDKLGLEVLAHHAAGLPWDNKKDGEPSEDILEKDWKQRPGMPKEGELPRILVVRPAWLTDGESKAETKADKKGDKPPYRVSEQEISGYGISRKDVAHFIVDAVTNSSFGYIIAVVSILDIGKGMVLSGSGQAEFITRYRAIVFKPFKGEVVDGVVNNVNKMGFFADVGPLTVFVSHQLIHPDMKFDPTSNPPSFASDEQIVEKNTRVRLKIVGTRVDATEIFAIGTIKEDHLGVID